MMGAGKFYSEENGYNRDVVIRNSVVHDVFGDGIILFRVRDGLIEASAAWLIGQEPSESAGTPNAIWTWSCVDCMVRDNEAFLTESPGVDGGAYDIDWATTRNSVEDNYAHDTQGYCMAVFGAGYVTHDAVLRGNVCIDNGMSPRMATLQGAIYIRTWNGGKIDGLAIEKNTIVWNPPVQAAPIVNDENSELTGKPISAQENIIRSSSPHLMQSFGDKLAFSGNRYEYHGAQSPYWNWNGKRWNSLHELQAAGAETGSEYRMSATRLDETSHGPVPGPKFDLGALEALPSLDGKPSPASEKTACTLACKISSRAFSASSSGSMPMACSLPKPWPGSVSCARWRASIPRGSCRSLWLSPILNLPRRCAMRYSISICLPFALYAPRHRCTLCRPR